MQFRFRCYRTPKFWGGPKVLTETINQLPGYISWRDTKAAILLFNRNKDFTRVLEQIKSTVQAHPNCKKLLGQPSETQWRFTFGQRDDPNREMSVAVMAFDVPQP